MPTHNTTKQEKHIAAAKDLATKLTLEAKMFKELRTYFMNLSNKFARTFARTGEVIPKAEHKKEMKEIIHHHYKTAATKFSGQIRSKLGQPDNNPEIFEHRINKSIDHHADMQSEESAEQISSTTHDHLHNSLRKVEVVAAAAGVVLTQAQKASRAKDEFYDSARSRVPLIATTEIQRASESGKFIELNELTNGDAYFENVAFNSMEKTKTWVAILDDHTREWHADADGQEVAIDEPFEVYGEELMVPGDDSLGASPENICNCRCCMITSVK